MPRNISRMSSPSHPDTTLRDDHDALIVARADAVGALIAPTVAWHDAEGRFPHDHFAVLHAHGALALPLPPALGGEGLSLYRSLLFQRQLGRYSGATALCLGWHLMALGCLAHTPSWRHQDFERLARDVVQRGDLINILVTERDHGNLLRGARPATLARRRAGGWVLSGHKAFCSSAPALRQMVVFASIEGEDRQGEFLVRVDETTRERIRILDDTWNVTGMRATASHDIVFDAVELPDEALVHRFGPGPDAPSSFAVASRAWGLQLPALYLGLAEAARDEALAFADGYRAASLGGQPVLDAPSVQARLGEIELLLGAARSQLFGLAERWERHPALQQRLHDEVAIAKVIVGRHAVQATQLAAEIVGGHSLQRNQPIERLLRDVQCQRFNPPQADTVVAGLARDATRTWRAAHPAVVATQSAASASPAPHTAPEAVAA